MKKYLILFIFIFFSSAFTQSSPYVLLISFDGFRWDYLDRGITPNLDKVIDSGVRALSMKPVTPSKTFPNHYSIVTGIHPENHGIIFNTFTDIHTGQVYRIGDTSKVRDPLWYKGEPIWETLENNGIITASYFWPGSELNDPKRRPTYFKRYKHTEPYKDRIDGVINWLKLPYNERPKFISFYFHDTDSYGHDFGPNSPEINESIKRLDTLVGYLDKELNKIGMVDSVNLVFVSDHGMTEIDTAKIINFENLLSGLEYKSGGSKPILMIEPSSEHYDSVYHRLKLNEDHFTVYKKEEIPDYFHFRDNKNIFSIIVVAEIGWSLVNNWELSSMKKYGSKGNHGYIKEELYMHGIFVAAGPNFNSNIKTGTIRNIDIYPLLCKIFNVYPNPEIDGKLERIEFFLKN